MIQSDGRQFLPKQSKFFTFPLVQIISYVIFFSLPGSLLSSFAAYALPEGGIVAAGEAIINSDLVSHYTEVVQHTEKAIIDWRKFDIGPQEHANFKQPSNGSITLNRINSDEASKINGQLTANGKLILINQNGIMFGKESKVDVNSLLATSVNVANDKFMDHDKLRDQRLLFSGQDASAAKIVNKGKIVAKGLVGLVAPNVINSGIIKARAGKIALISGDSFALDFYGDNILDVEVSAQVTSQILVNTGQIVADGGEIILTAAAGKEIVNSLVVNTGLLSSRSISRKNGEIIISAEGSNAVKGNTSSDKGKKTGNSTVLIKGVLDVSGMQDGENGGKLQVTADEIGLMEGVLINASGHTGKAGLTIGLEKSAKRDGAAGGEILIGGDYLGQGNMPTAKYLYVAPDAVIFNEALDIGDAGRNIFWSDGTTQFYGHVFARALGGKNVDEDTGHAALGGNLGDGGFVETSGKGRLDARGMVDLTASNGEVGTYLLDPSSVSIYGNVDPSFTSTDGTVNLAQNLKVWIDFSDQSLITLSYQAVLNGVTNTSVTATGTMGNNSLTVNASTYLFVGARIMLGATGTQLASVTETANGVAAAGNDIYTITAINGTTITVAPNLKKNYSNASLNQGYISIVEGKTLHNYNGTNYKVNATQTKVGNRPLWLNGILNNLGVARFKRNVEYLSVKLTDAAVPSTNTVDFIKNQINHTLFLGFNVDTLNTGNAQQYILDTVYSLGTIQQSGQPWNNYLYTPLIVDGGWCYTNQMNSGTTTNTNKDGFLYGNSNVLGNNINPHLIANVFNYYQTNVSGVIKYNLIGTSYVDGVATQYQSPYALMNPRTITNSSKDFVVISSLNPKLNLLGAATRNPSTSSTTYTTITDEADWFFRGQLYEVIEYDTNLADAVRNLVEQYQSAKWNIALTAQPTTSYASGVDGSSSLTTNYLSKLSSSGNVAILADNVTIDLKNDTANLNLSSDKNLSITARTSLTVPSSGTISTTTTSTGGNITIQLDSGNADLSNLTLKANNGGQININATAGKVTLGNMNAGSILVKANGSTNDLIIPSGKSLTTTGAGNPLILVAGRNFINNNPAGATVLTTANGTYWRIYMNNFSGNIGTDASYLGTSSIKYSTTYNAGSIPTDPNNLLIYATFVKGNLNIVPNASSLSLTYGDAAPNLSSIAFTLTGYVAPDTYSSDVITGQPAFTTNYTQGSNIGNYSLTINPGTLSSNLGYVFNSSNLSSFIQVNPKTLNISLTGSVTKEYDATRNATLASGNYSLSGTVVGDVVSLNNPSSGTYDTKSIGNNKNVTVTGLTISGTKAGNYVLGSTSATSPIGSITQKSITANLTGTVTKEYDGNTTANLTPTNYTLSGIISGDIINLNNPVSSTYDSKSIGSNKTITVTGVSIGGMDAGNYTLGANTNLTANIGVITAKTLTASLIGSVTKEYDGTTDAVLSPGNYSLPGVVVGEVVNLNNPSVGTYNSKFAGTNKNITVTGLAITGTDLGNYLLGTTSATAPIGVITPKAVTASLIGPVTKEYDGTTDALLTASNYDLTGVINQDIVTLNNPALGTYDSKSVGSGKGVTVIGLGLDGSDANNYTLGANNSLTISTGEITHKNIMVSLTGTINKVYDGTDNALLTPDNYILSGAITGDDVYLNNPAIGFYDTKTPGYSKGITVAGVTINGADANNYNLVAN